MTKVIGGPLQTHFDLATTKLTTLARVKPVIGSAFGLTDHDQDISFDDGDGSITYKTVAGYLRTAVESRHDMAVDNLDIQGMFDVVGIEKVDFETGVMDFAEVRVHLVNWSDLSQGSVVMRQGHVGQVTTAFDFVTEIRGMLQRFVQEVVELIAPTCRAPFGDAAAAKPRCFLDIVGVPWSTSLVTTKRLAADATNETVVRPSSYNDRWFVSTNVGLTGPSEPAWDTTIGNTTTETLSVAAWVTATSYPAGSQVFENSLIFVSDGGTSGGPEPTWPSNPGDTVADNDIEWTAHANVATIWETVQARRIDVTVNVVTNEMQFSITTTTDAPDTFFAAGFILITSGDNNNLKGGTVDWDLATKTLKLFLPLPLILSSGDTLTVVVGCDRRRPTCVGFDNMINFQGEPDLPGNDQIFRIPDLPPSG